MGNAASTEASSSQHTAIPARENVGAAACSPRLAATTSSPLSTATPQSEGPGEPGNVQQKQPYVPMWLQKAPKAPGPALSNTGNTAPPERDVKQPVVSDAE